MIAKRETLLLFTASFPFGNPESHLESEIEFLAKEFKQVFIFPFSENHERRYCPGNVKVISFDKEIGSGKFKIFFKNFFLICSILIKEFYHNNNKIFFFKYFRIFNTILMNYLFIAGLINKKLNSEVLGNSICYSYWFENWATILSILKLKKVIGSYVSRAHGFDLFYERWPDQIIPFRYLQLKMVSKVFPDSKTGETYMKEKGVFPQKVSCSYYGVADNGNNPFDEESVFRVVSCSSLIPLKRVHLVIEILQKLDFHVEWVHFGDGELLDQLQEKCALLPNNVLVKFMGHRSNKDLLTYYKTVPVNLFITVSETEGLPMSLIEACSFGIPIIGTAVGGVPEIVNDQTGILIPKDFIPDKIAKRIEEFKNSEMNTPGFRVKVKSFWFNNFNAQVNYNKFINQIKSVI